MIEDDRGQCASADNQQLALLPPVERPYYERLTPTVNYSRYRLNWSGDSLIDLNGLPFDSAMWSDFKYGSTQAANVLARQLYAEFVGEHGNALFQADTPVVVTCSPFKFVPTAAHSLATAFYAFANYDRSRQGLPRVSRLRYHREAVSPGDYGKLNQQERLNRMASNGLSLDYDYLKGKRLIVIDDIHVTGAHQKKIGELLRNVGLESLYFLHIAEIEESIARSNPQIEYHLNHANVHGLNDVGRIIRSGDFALNARVCKFILDPQHSEGDRIAFLESLSDEQLDALYRGVVGDSYHTMQMYRKGFSALLNAVSHRNIQVF